MREETYDHMQSIGYNFLFIIACTQILEFKMKNSRVRIFKIDQLSASAVCTKYLQKKSNF